MNTSLPSLTDAAEESKAKSWTILPSSSGNQDHLALYRSVATEGFDIPCGQRHSFFDVSVHQNIGNVGKPAAQPLETLEHVKATAKHAGEGDDQTKRLVHDMLRFLWWGDNFNHSRPDALRDGYVRLHSMLAEITRVTVTYSGVVKPAADHCFSPPRTAEIHNKCKVSSTWMNAHI